MPPTLLKKTTNLTFLLPNPRTPVWYSSYLTSQWLSALLVPRSFVKALFFWPQILHPLPSFPPTSMSVPQSLNVGTCGPVLFSFCSLTLDNVTHSYNYKCSYVPRTLRFPSPSLSCLLSSSLYSQLTTPLSYLDIISDFRQNTFKKLNSYHPPPLFLQCSSYKLLHDLPNFSQQKSRKSHSHPLSTHPSVNPRNSIHFSPSLSSLLLSNAKSPQLNLGNGLLTFNIVS